MNSRNCSDTFINDALMHQRLQPGSKSLKSANESNQSPVGSNPAIWIYIGLLIALIVGTIILYCGWKRPTVVQNIEKDGAVIDANEYTPLLVLQKSSNNNYSYHL
jgi:hypothetical protein